ncbi:MAG: hypothetical protein NEHIOOID_00517 [Holosporales bacterium]
MFYFIFAMFLGILSATEIEQMTPYQIIRQTRSLPLSIHRQQIAHVTFVADPYDNFVSVHILGPCIPILPDNNNIIYLKNKPYMADQILSEQTLLLKPYYILSCAEYPNHENLLTFFSCVRPLHFLRICLTFVDVLSKTFKEYLLMYPTSVDIVNAYASELFPNVLMCPLVLLVDKTPDSPNDVNSLQSNSLVENLNFCESKNQKVEVPARKKHRARRYKKK